MKTRKKYPFLALALSLALVVSQTPIAFADSATPSNGSTEAAVGADFLTTNATTVTDDAITYTPFDPITPSTNTPKEEKAAAIEEATSLALNTGGLPYANDKIIVTYDGSFAKYKLRASSGLKTLAEDTHGNVVVSQQIPEGTSVKEAIVKAKSSPGVVAAQPNFIYKSLATTNDPMLNTNSDDWWQWLSVVGAQQAWDITKTEKSVTVAVLDTGATINHEDLRDNISSYAYDAHADMLLTQSISNGYIDSSGDGDTGSSHGTHVSGIVGAVANNGKGGAGISYNANVLPVNVFNEGNADSETLVTAYNYVINLKTSGKVSDLRVVNLSLGGYLEYPYEYVNPNLLDDDVWHSAIVRAETAGILTVAAGGNDNVSKTSFPADWDEVLCVAGIDMDSNHWVESTGGGSDHNQYKDICAPSKDIVSTMNPAIINNPYCPLSGTSMASPIVAGAAALVWAANPNLTVADVKHILISTADDLGEKGRDDYYGHGRLDVDEAVKVAKTYKQPQGFFNISSKLKNTLLINVKGNSTKNGAVIESKTKNRMAGQVFQVVYNKAGYYKIKNPNSNRYLAIKGGVAKNNAAIIQAKSSSSNAQRWLLEREPDGSYVITSKANTKYCIEIPDASKKSGTALKLGVKNLTAEQKFSLSADLSKAVSSGTYTIGAIKAPNQVLYVRGGSKKSKANIQLAKAAKSKANAQRFKITFDKKTGMYKILNVGSKKALNVAGTKDKSNVRIYNAKKVLEQRWYIEKINAKQFRIYAASSGKALDTAGSKYSSGTNVYVNKKSSSKSQIWTIKKAG